MFENSKAFSGFAVPDVGAAKRFYGDTLGVKAEPGEMGLLMLDFGDGNLVIVYEKPDHQPANFTILNFPVDDVDAAVDELTSKGVEMERYDGFDQDEKGIARGEGPDIAWFTDPAGNILSVLKEQ